MPLERIALLYNRDRLHFNIQSSGADKGSQISPGIIFEDVDNTGNPCYIVRVNFNGTMFGSFSQWVVFDFGNQPYLVRKLAVEVGAKSSHEKVKSLRQKLQFDRWTSENREIVRFDTKFVDELGEKLKRQYKAPSSSETVVTQHTVATELNRNNYQHKMHNLLELEEIERHKIISRYEFLKTLAKCGEYIVITMSVIILLLRRIGVYCFTLFSVTFSTTLFSVTVFSATTHHSVLIF